ncbi:MAG: anion permease, partial [Thermodesulfobacteriota bacterium]|nr:anion permease [Thermodesulfobacteriota bacterium]
MDSNKESSTSWRQKIGLMLGIPIFLIILFLPRPETMSPEAHKTMAIAILMAWWWTTEAIPIPATALIPIVAFPLLNVMKTKEVVTSYADSNIYL